MMDAKNALVEADGDFEKAKELLRIAGQAKADKRGEERSATNGIVVFADGALVQLGAETDFVAKNAEFQALADQILDSALAAKTSDVEELKAAKLDEGTVADAVQALSAKIGEKLELRRVVYYDGPVAVYLHKRASDLPPAVGVLVSYDGEGDAAAEAARNAAQQVAALKARYATRDEVPADVVENERRIAEETAKAEGKPEKALPKIVEGRLTGFFKDSVLIDQPFVKDSKKTVKNVLDEAGATVKAFTRFEVGQS